MKYTEPELVLREKIFGFMDVTKQDRMVDVVSFLIGYYGSLTPGMWKVVVQLHARGIIK